LRAAVVRGLYSARFNAILYKVRHPSLPGGAAAENETENTGQFMGAEEDACSCRDVDNRAKDGYG